MVAIDELSAIVAFAQAKEKAETLIALLTQIALKGRSSGVILVAFRSSPALILSQMR